MRFPKSYDTNEPDFFDDGDQYSNPPLIAFHGAQDVVNYYPDALVQDIHNSIIPSRKKESFCLLSANYFTIKNPTDSNYVYVKKGSGLNMYNILSDSRINRYVELYTDCNAGHGFIGGNTDYSSGSYDQIQVLKYISARAAVFFQTIMNYSGSAIHPPFNSSIRSFFTDCKNIRKCQGNGSTTDDCGTNDIVCDTDNL